MSGRSTMEGAGACANVPLTFLRLVWLTIALVFGPAAQAQSPAPNSPVTVLFSFFAESTSNQPISMIKARSGIFYGTTIGGEINLGTIFSITEGGSFATLHSFSGTDGDFPYGQLAEGSDGSLYGTTIYGGATNQGVAFRITPEGAFTILHDFGSDASDGTHPWGGVVQGRDGNSYGTTFDGGLNGAGTVYRLTPEGAVTVLHNFSASGGYPNGQTLTRGRDRFLYGGTCNEFVGAGKYDSIFRISRDGNFKVLYRFPNPPSGIGYCPVAPLIQARDGDFYGTTQGGGPDNVGTVFRMTAGGEVTFLHTFHQTCLQQGCQNDGNFPTNALVEAPDGFFYSTISGCNTGRDCAYRISRSGEFTSNIYDFTSQEAMSAGNLIPGDEDGLYYSFAQGGGMLEHVSDGDVFSINLKQLSKDLGPGW